MKIPGRTLDYDYPLRIRECAVFRGVGSKPSSVIRAMGSLIKKRRKRMRKKKHKKMLKRTRFQRRAAGK